MERNQNYDILKDGGRHSNIEKEGIKDVVRMNIGHERPPLSQGLDSSYRPQS